VSSKTKRYPFVRPNPARVFSKTACTPTLFRKPDKTGKQARAPAGQTNRGGRRTTRPLAQPSGVPRMPRAAACRWTKSWRKGADTVSFYDENTPNRQNDKTRQKQQKQKRQSPGQDSNGQGWQDEQQQKNQNQNQYRV
jgi:hypothetical protein